jgi:triosephosphate isomerase
MLIAGNWKMNTDIESGTRLAAGIAAAANERDLGSVALAVCPPYVSLESVGNALGDSGVALGAQNIHHKDSGAFTGEVSAEMLLSAGCTHVIVGHSERREYFGESNHDIQQKVAQARANGLVPILCVGETKAERDAGDARAVVKGQLRGGLADVLFDAPGDLVVAYEPVWAIGTGDTATPEQANEMHAFIREELADLYDDDFAGGVEILYGGSMKPHNAEDLLSQPDVNGGLVGGASLDVDSFIGIAEHGAAIAP